LRAGKALSLGARAEGGGNRTTAFMFHHNLIGCRMHGVEVLRASSIEMQDLPLTITVCSLQKGKEPKNGAEEGAAEEDGEPSIAAEDLVAKGLLEKQSPLYRAAVRIQARYRGYVVRKVRQPPSPLSQPYPSNLLNGLSTAYFHNCTSSPWAIRIWNALCGTFL